MTHNGWGCYYEPETKPANHVEEEKRPFIVCPTCEGNGTHGPGHVYTEDMIAEFDPQEFAEMMRDYREGVYDVRCEGCGGKRVVKAPCACTACEQERRDIAEMEDMARAERAFGC